MNAIRFTVILICTLLFAFSAARSQELPDISNFEEIGRDTRGAFAVNVKDSVGSPTEVKFMGLLAHTIGDGYDPDNWIVSAFIASCESGEAIQKNSIGIVNGVKYEKDADPKAAWRKPEKNSPLERAILFVCKKKFGERI